MSCFDLRAPLCIGRAADVVAVKSFKVLQVVAVKCFKAALAQRLPVTFLRAITAPIGPE